MWKEVVYGKKVKSLRSQEVENSTMLLGGWGLGVGGIEVEQRL